MYVYEEEFEIPVIPGHKGLLGYFEQAIENKLSGSLLPVRFAVTETNAKTYKCELGVISGLLDETIEHSCSIFNFHQRIYENQNAFNAVLVIPTGIGSELGGHAGDANPTAKLLASICDTLITHPNVVNASDLNELPDNGLYVEGSIISRLLMGSIGIQPVRSNRVLTVLNSHADSFFSNAIINSVNAARASCGLDSQEAIILDPSVSLKSLFASSGRAVGRVDKMDALIKILNERKGTYDALAIATQIEMPFNYHTDYYKKAGEMINPWGGVEAIFTHTISSLFDIPAAHAPMDDSREISNLNLGIVDPRMAAEVISEAYFLCVLKGLQRAPRIIKDIRYAIPSGALTVSDVSCLVIPDGCVGLPTLAALEQGIPVIAVRENRNIMKNTLSALPWRPGQLHIVENYWEAAGVMSALKAGIEPSTVRRPIADINYSVTGT